MNEMKSAVIVVSMYDRAAKTTNNRVSTSIVFMGIPSFVLLEGI